MPQPSEVTKIAFVLVLARYLRFRSNYRTLSGTEGSVDEAQVNWRKTTELTSDMRSADRPMLARQTN